MDELEKRQSGMRMWSDASGMFEAAMALRRDNEQGHLFVRYRLLTHAAESACKGVLRATGSSVRDLRDYGHRVVEVYDEAVRRGMPSCIGQMDYVRFNRLAEYYEDTLLRYSAVGAYPGLSSEPKWLEKVIEKLLVESLVFCRKHVS